MVNYIDSAIAKAKIICKQLGCNSFEDALKKLEMENGKGKNREISE